MRSLSRRFGIAALSVALVATLIGSTQAGIIPWAYNLVFGPVGYGPSGYGAPAYPYAYPMTARYGCGPCRTPVQISCRPSPCSPCSSGSCPTVVAYGPRQSCEVGREVTRWKSDETQTLKANEITRRTPSPVDTPPAPKSTFAEEGDTVAESDKSTEENSNPPAAVAAEATPGDVNVPATVVTPPAPPAGVITTGAPGDPGFVSSPEPEAATTTPAADVVSAPDEPLEFAPPIPGAKPAEVETGTPAPTLPADVLKPADVDGETSWKLTVPTQRLARRASYRNAQIARRSVSVDSEYVIPSESVAHIVTRD